MPNQSFSTDLWDRDIAALPSADREIATDLLVFACLELGCRPYHRASKSTATSDRQTILKHPKTGHACLVLSAVPKEDDPAPYRLRVDFFDREEGISVPFTTVHRAPNTQFSKKGERRFFASSAAPRDALHLAVRNIIALER